MFCSARKGVLKRKTADNTDDEDFELEARPRSPKIRPPAKKSKKKANKEDLKDKDEDPTSYSRASRHLGANKVKCPECPLSFKKHPDMLAHSIIHRGHIRCPIHNILFQQVGLCDV